MKTRTVGADMFYAGVRTDRQTWRSFFAILRMRIKGQMRSVG